MVTIYHNQRCGKSRTACEFYKTNNKQFAIYLYLQMGLTHDRVEEILTKGNYQPLDIIRTNEEVFKLNYKDKELSREQWIEALIANPILLQRPIVVGMHKAMIVRSDDSLNQALASVE